MYIIVRGFGWKSCIKCNRLSERRLASKYCGSQTSVSLWNSLLGYPAAGLLVGLKGSEKFCGGVVYAVRCLVASSKILVLCCQFCKSYRRSGLSIGLSALLRWIDYLLGFSSTVGWLLCLIRRFSS